MANQEFKTTVISFDADQPDASKVEVVKPSIEKSIPQNILFNVTSKVPHVVETLPTVKVEQTQPTKKIELRTVEEINPSPKALPKFYLREYKRSFRLVIMWLIITAICVGLETWALVAIIQSNISNWAALTLIPALTLCVAFLIIYINNWINFRNEARNVDFSQGKIPTISVMKLYKRLKTAHINVNWFCGLTYVAGGLAILITYIIGFAVSKNWGDLSPENIGQPFGASLLITLIVCASAMGVAFILHVVLLVMNYTRAAKIDNFYSVQIVSDEELNAIKKKKSKRDFFIFLAVVMILVLIGMMIYKLVKSRKVNNNVTINNGPTVKAI